MKPEGNPVPFYLTAAGAAGEVGCLITLSAGGSVVLGLLVDRLLGTNHLFLFLFLLGSIPLNLWLIYRYTVYKSRRLQAASKKEDTASDD
ncbi:MAG TPA: hypothetical protein VHD90_09955 [Phototrophicaceae bacterium]|nr:hypothetical protein [Phototrophicaceae bacterium]